MKKKRRQQREGAERKREEHEELDAAVALAAAERQEQVKRELPARLAALQDEQEKELADPEELAEVARQRSLLLAEAFRKKEQELEAKAASKREELRTLTLPGREGPKQSPLTRWFSSTATPCLEGIAAMAGQRGPRHPACQTPRQRELADIARQKKQLEQQSQQLSADAAKAAKHARSLDEEAAAALQGQASPASASGALAALDAAASPAPTGVLVPAGSPAPTGVLVPAGSPPSAARALCSRRKPGETRGRPRGPTLATLRAKAATPTGLKGQARLQQEAKKRAGEVQQRRPRPKVLVALRNEIEEAAKLANFEGVPPATFWYEQAAQRGYAVADLKAWVTPQVIKNAQTWLATVGPELRVGRRSTWKRFQTKDTGCRVGG